MIDGKVADPEDYFHQFMLNGYGYLGMKRMGEVFEAIGAEEAESLQKEAADWRNDIRESLERNVEPDRASLDGSSGTAPAVPTGRMFPLSRHLYRPGCHAGADVPGFLRGNRPGRARFGPVVEISQRTDVPGKFDFQPTVLQPPWPPTPIREPIRSGSISTN